MAPPKLFINTKTLDVEKQPDHLETDLVDGLKSESKADGINTSAVEKGDFFFCLNFFTVSCICLGLTSIAAAVSFDF